MLLQQLWHQQQPPSLLLLPKLTFRRRRRSLRRRARLKCGRAHGIDDSALPCEGARHYNPTFDGSRRDSFRISLLRCWYGPAYVTPLLRVYALELAGHNSCNYQDHRVTQLSFNLSWRRPLLVTRAENRCVFLRTFSCYVQRHSSSSPRVHLPWYIRIHIMYVYILPRRSDA
jgi:hypothetical protein